jgi:hypothetical protein
MIKCEAAVRTPAKTVSTAAFLSARIVDEQPDSEMGQTAEVQKSVFSEPITGSANQ